MATSSPMSTTNKYIKYTITITQNSQNVTANTSNVTVSVRFYRTNTGYTTYGSGTVYCNINGTTYSKSVTSSQKITHSGIVLFTKTLTIPHNDDGSKTLACSAWISHSQFDSSGQRYTQALTTIPRKSSLSVSNGTLGTSQTLTINRKASSFTHTIKYTCGSASGTIDTKTTSTSVSWVPPLTLARQNTTGTSVSVVLTLTTYNGDASIGSSSVTISCSIPSSVKPTVSFATSDETQYSYKYGGYVQGLSRLKVTASGNGNQGSTIKSCVIKVDGKTYTSNPAIADPFMGSGSLIVNVTVTDSRNRTATATKTISVLPYITPQINSLIARRCNEDGSSNSAGTFMAVVFDATVTSLNGKNSAVYTIQYKKANATSYTTETLAAYGGKYSVSDGIFVFPADTASSYDIILTVNDDFRSPYRTVVGSSVRKLWSVFRRGLGIAFGKVAELEGVFDVDMPIRARKGITVDTEWIPLNLASTFANYNGTASNQPMYKVTGNVVTVCGCVSPITQYTSSTEKVVFATGIPTALCPPSIQSFICQGSGMNRWQCTIETNGSLTIARYGTTEATTVPTTAWLIFNCTYSI